jgi:hypothetical protein
VIDVTQFYVTLIIQHVDDLIGGGEILELLKEDSAGIHLLLHNASINTK